jgi:hypothetical protein
MLRKRLKTLEDQHAVGAAGELEVLRARLDLKEQEIALQSLARQLRELMKPS